jgi:catechol 2,3-dioxygenase-like lactoylglutathione lyase family enzyme
VLGRFHEISIETPDIRASVEFYERLGFTQAATTDAWSHPYGVLTDGRVFIGLHQRGLPSPSVTFVRAGIAGQAAEFERRGIDLELLRAGDEVFNEIAFRDPDGQRIAVLEARTYSPVARAARDTSLCGYFTELSLPSGDFDAARAFWEPLGFVATEEALLPYPRLPLTSDGIDIAFHRRSTHDHPLLVFEDPAMRERIARMRELGLPLAAQTPRGLSAHANALLSAPEGTLLLLLESAD